MGLPKLWGKDKSGSRGFVFSHVKTIYYNWASKILLKTKLDEMDALIDAKIAKAMMSNQQVNDANKVPTSALVYEMGQNIAENANDIAEINGNIQGINSNLIRGNGYTALEVLNDNGTIYRMQLSANGGLVHLYENSGSGWNRTDSLALKSDFGWKHLADVTTNNPISFPESANEVFLETLIRKGESYFFDSRVLGKINKGAYQVIKFLLDGYGYYLVNEMGSVHFSNFKVGNDTPDEFMVTVRYR